MAAPKNDNNNLFKGLGIEELLAISFHRSCRVPDHENPEIQPITKSAPHTTSLPCQVVRTQVHNIDKKLEDVYELPMKRA